jgi:hypothetical protein
MAARAKPLVDPAQGEKATDHALYAGSSCPSTELAIMISVPKPWQQRNAAAERGHAWEEIKCRLGRVDPIPRIGYARTCLVKRPRPTRRNDQLSAVVGKSVSSCSTDPARSSCDDNDLVLQPGAHANAPSKL